MQCVNRNKKAGIPTQKPYKQGEQISVQLQLFETVDIDGEQVETPIKDFTNCRLNILIRSARTHAVLISTQNDLSSLPVQIDNEGYVAFIIGGDLTRTMQGRYYIEIEIVKNSNSMISQTTYAFEVAASSVVKYTSWLRVTPQRLNLKATDTGADIRVCASGQWSVTTDVLWLSFSVLNGNGATKLHLMCETNVTTAKRTGIMTITMDSRSITVRVTQGAAEVV